VLLLTSAGGIHVCYALGGAGAVRVAAVSAAAVSVSVAAATWHSGTGSAAPLALAGAATAGSWLRRNRALLQLQLRWLSWLGWQALPGLQYSLLGLLAVLMRILAVQVSRQALRVLLQLVRAVRQYRQVSWDGGVAGYCDHLAGAAASAAGAAVEHRAAGCQRRRVDSCCRVLAAALVADLAQAGQDVVLYCQLAGLSSSAALDGGTAAQHTVPAAAAADACACCRLTQQPQLADVAEALLDCLEPVVTQTLMPAAGRQLPGFRGKALVKGCLQVRLVAVPGVTGPGGAPLVHC